MLTFASLWQLLWPPARRRRAAMVQAQEERHPVLINTNGIPGGDEQWAGRMVSHLLWHGAALYFGDLFVSSILLCKESPSLKNRRDREREWIRAVVSRKSSSRRSNRSREDVAILHIYGRPRSENQLISSQLCAPQQASDEPVAADRRPPRYTHAHSPTSSIASFRSFVSRWSNDTSRSSRSGSKNSWPFSRDTCSAATVEPRAGHRISGGSADLGPPPDIPPGNLDSSENRIRIFSKGISDNYHLENNVCSSFTDMPAGLLLVEQLLRLVHSASYEVGQFKFGDAQNEVLVRVIWNVLRRVVLHALDRGFTDVVERAEDVWKPQGSTAVLHATSQAGEPLNLRWLTDLVDHRHSQDWRTFKKDQHSAKKEQKEELRTKENLAQAKKDLHRADKDLHRADKDLRRADRKAEESSRKAEQESRRAEQESRRADEERKRRKEESRRAEEADRRAEESAKIIQDLQKRLEAATRPRHDQ